MDPVLAGAAEIDAMQCRWPGQLQASEEGDIDAATVVAFNEDARPVPRGREILLPKSLQDSDVFDLL